MVGMDIETLAATRRALHGVAEILLAGPQYRASGTIRLRQVAGGFASRFAPELRVAGGDLVAGGRRLPLDGATCVALAEAAGVVPGAPAGLYHDGSGVGPDEPLSVDPEAARAVADCFAVGAEALHATFPDTDPVLWPEHFDLGITVGAVNYGVSPGDGYLPEPYAYVGPHEPRRGDFWNAPFGAARTLADLGDAQAVAAFLARGRELTG